MRLSFQINDLCHPRDRARVALAQRVGARLGVCLASGETNISWQITRSVICFDMREQSLYTIVRNSCRALGKLFEVAIAPTSTSSDMDLIPPILPDFGTHCHNHDHKKLQSL